jgi:hypothetical protein
MAVKVIVCQGTAVSLNEGIDPRNLLAFREKFTKSESASMNVDGSTTPQEFSIVPESGYAKMIGQIRLLIHASQLDISGVQGQQFGASHPNGLTNGLQLYYSYNTVQSDIFLDPVKILTDFYWYVNEIQSDIRAVDSQTDLLIIQINMCTPIMLLSGESDELSILISDDLTGLTRFEAMVLGVKEATS